MVSQKSYTSFFSKPNIGLIQCRWGHVNEDYSTITQVQALSLDFHFLIEQKAKSDSHLFMNFNGLLEFGNVIALKMLVVGILQHLLKILI